MTATRVVVVGAGGIGSAYADLLAGSAITSPVGVADVRLDAALAWATRAGTGIEAMTDVSRLLDLAPQVAVLCTPPSSHAPLAELFLRAGVAVLSEKPMAATLEQARAMHRVAVETGVPLGMAAKFRFCADVIAARDLLESGVIGPLRLVENAFTSRIDMGLRWNSQRAVSGGGVIIDNGTHSIDLLHFLGLNVREVFVTEQARPAGFEVEDTARLHLVTDDGCDALLDLSWSIDKSLDDFLGLYGTEGEIRVGWRESRWRLHGGEWQVFGTGYDNRAAMGGALEQFCAAARGDELPEVDSRRGIAVAAVIEGAYHSLARGRWAKVNPVWLD